MHRLHAALLHSVPLVGSSEQCGLVGLSGLSWILRAHFQLLDHVLDPEPGAYTSTSSLHTCPQSSFMLAASRHSLLCYVEALCHRLVTTLCCSRYSLPADWIMCAMLQVHPGVPYGHGASQLPAAHAGAPSHRPCAGRWLYGTAALRSHTGHLPRSILPGLERIQAARRLHELKHILWVGALPQQQSTLAASYKDARFVSLPDAGPTGGMSLGCTQPCKVGFSFWRGAIAVAGWGLTDLWNSHLQQVVACRGRARISAWLLQEVVSEGHLSQQTKCNRCQESSELTTLTAGACPQEMVGTVQRIMDNGHAYSAEGDVYFDVGSLPGYGRLSGRAQVGCLGCAGTPTSL